LFYCAVSVILCFLTLLILIKHCYMILISLSVLTLVMMHCYMILVSFTTLSSLLFQFICLTLVTLPLAFIDVILAIILVKCSY
jgi:hypothetical protein